MAEPVVRLLCIFGQSTHRQREDMVRFLFQRSATAGVAGWWQRRSIRQRTTRGSPRRRWCEYCYWLTHAQGQGAVVSAGCPFFVFAHCVATTPLLRHTSGWATLA